MNDVDDFKIIHYLDEYEDQLSSLYYECFRNDDVYKNDDDDIYILIDLSTDNVVASLALTKESEDEASIWSVCCTTNYRRKGFAKKLITAVINDTKNNKIKKYWLMVDSNNKAAISLYSKIGFEMDIEYNAMEEQYARQYDSVDVSDDSNDSGCEQDNIIYKMFLLRGNHERNENENENENDNMNDSGWCQIL